MIKKTLVHILILFSICGITYAQDNFWTDFGRNALVGIYSGIDQYNRVFENLTIHYENEIHEGLQTGLYSNDLNINQYARLYIIFNRILESEYLKQYRDSFNWRIYLVNLNYVGGFASVNGIIGINTGLIDFCLNDDELAMIIGHEIAHIVKNHYFQRIASRMLRDQILNVIYSIAFQFNFVSDKEMFDQIFGFAGNTTLLNFRRNHEIEADREGAIYAASVGYNPDTGYDFWRRLSLSAVGMEMNQALLGTHPYSEDRARTFLTGNYQEYYNPDFNYQIDHDPDLAWAYNIRGVNSYINGDYNTAIEFYTHAVRLDINNDTIKRNMGYAYNMRGIDFLEAGDIDNAVSDFEMALQMNINDSNARAWLNYAMRQQNQ